MAVRQGYRAGGKVGGTHGTCVPIAGDIIDVAQKCPHVRRIVPGIIIPGQGSSGGKKRVKITSLHGGLLLKVRASGVAQEVRVCVSNAPDAIRWFTERLPKLGLEVSAPADTS